MIKFVVSEYVNGNLVEKGANILTPEMELLQVSKRIAEIEAHLSGKMAEMMKKLDKFEINGEIVEIERLRGSCTK